MQKISFGELKDMQLQIARQFSPEDRIKIDEIRYVAGFDLAYFGNKCVCSAVVLDFKTLEVVERKFLVTKTPMNYVPGFLAFREGPPICQTYYDLEYEPDIIMLDGHGIAHPIHCGEPSNELPSTFGGSFYCVRRLFYGVLYLVDSFTSRASEFFRAPNNRFDSSAGLSNCSAASARPRSLRI